MPTAMTSLRNKRLDPIEAKYADRHLPKVTARRHPLYDAQHKQHSVRIRGKARGKAVLQDRKRELFLQHLAVVLDRLENRLSLEERLQTEATKWDRETAHLSSPLQRTTHPSYQAILGMGAQHKKDVIQFMLRDMKQNRRDWFLALSYLAQENPINPKDAGKTDKIIESWVRWGESQGLI
jgi:hypothetical protein